MDDDKNAFATQVSGDSEDEENAGNVDPGFVDVQEAQAQDRENADTQENYTESVRKRIHAQERKHQRQMREMQQQMLHMQAQMAHAESANPSLHESASYVSPGQPSSPGMTEEERIQKAVRFALGAKEHEERQAKEAERQAHVQKQYHRLNNEFDNASERYEDFDEVVRGEDMPFTPHVRDALLLVENPADVAYKLGKNRSELERISKLHPLDQVREVNKLSFSLMGGNNGKPSHTRTNPLGNIKANPASASTTVTDKTSPSEIRRRMRAGTFK
jgi:hypothetical protein